MKKLWIGVLGLGVAAAVGWGAFWYVGKGRVDARIDAEIAALEQAGWTITFGSREVSGFPLGYRVELGDIGIVRPANGVLIRVPEVQVELPPGGGPAPVALPGGVRLDAPVDAALRLNDPDLPAVMRLAFEVEGLAVDAPEDGVFAANAEGVQISMDQDDYHGKFRFLAAAVSGTLGRHTSEMWGELSAGSIRLDASTAAPGAAPVTLDLKGEDVNLKTWYALPLGGLLTRIAVDGGDERAEIDYRFGAMEMTISADGSASGGVQGRFGVSGKEAVGRVEASGGALRLDAQSEGVTWLLEPGNGVTPPLAGSVAISFGKVSQVLPLRASETAVEAPTRLVLDGVVPNEALWQVLDPRGVLDREAASLSLDATARTKVRHAMLAGADRPRISYEPTNLALEAFSLSALGAEVSAKGDVDILQPILVPLGEIEIEVTGPVGVLGALEKAGLISTEQREMGDAILQVYARPSGGGDRWVTEVGFGTEGISVNGLPVQ